MEKTKNVHYFFNFQKNAQNEQSPNGRKIRPIWSPWSRHASIPTADGISYLCKLQFFQFEAKLHRTDDAFLLVSFTSAVSKVHTYIHK
jgi:hypothetical protein